VTRKLHTPAGLKYGSYAMILSIITGIVAVLLLLLITGIDFETVTEGNVLQVLAGALALICVLGILALIGIIFYILLLYEMYVGREEFGAKHAGRVTAGVILIIFAVIFTIITSFIGGGLGLGGDPSVTTVQAADLRNELVISSGLGIVSAVAQTLGLVFFAIELIGDNKRFLLWAAFGLTVAASFIGIIVALVWLPSEGTLELQDVLKWSSYTTAASAFSVLGTIVMLVAYRMTRARILSGEIMPVPPPMQPPMYPPQAAWGQQPPPTTVEEPPTWEELEPAEEPEE
jgi:hypothetical protein